MTEPMKTAEQILLEKVGKLALSGLKWKSLDDRKQLVLQAMQEYADQEKSAERKKVKYIIKQMISDASSWTNEELYEIIDSL